MTPNDIQVHCDKARAFYQEKPGFSGIMTIDDLYTTIKRLAEIIKAQQETIDKLRKD